MKHNEIIMNQPNLNQKITVNFLETIAQKEQELEMRYLQFFEVYNPIKNELDYRSKLVRHNDNGDDTIIMIANESVFKLNCMERCIAVEPASNYFTIQDFTIVPKDNNKISLHWKTRKPLQQFHRDQLAYLKNPMKRLVLNRDKGRR